MESVAKVEYNARNLTTRSVTLFPTRAQVFRDIKDVPLQPGTNEITILGLTPTVDGDSIKVEGSGSAIISDIAVESLPNRDIFEEVYPDSDDDKVSSDGEASDDDGEVDLPESPELIAARNRGQELEDRMKMAKELIQSAYGRLNALDDYTKTLSCEHGVAIESSIESNRKVREVIFRDQMEGEKRERELKEPIRKASVEINRLSKIHRREKSRANKERKKALMAKTKAKIKEARREEERLNEKERILKERQKFWPKYCYAVRITLEAPSHTPQSSRRNSVASDIEMVGETPSTPLVSQGNEPGGTCDLVLSYMTSSASWSPSYDLQLSTVNASGSLCFDAQLSNTTSETWEKCKITLSTSQTTSSCLDDTAPALIPWRIKLDSYAAENSLLYSTEEQNHKATLKYKQNNAVRGKTRASMFGAETRPAALGDYQMQLMLLEQQNKKRLEVARAEQRHPAPPPPPPPPPVPAGAPPTVGKTNRAVAERSEGPRRQAQQVAMERARQQQQQQGFQMMAQQQQQAPGQAPGQSLNNATDWFDGFLEDTAGKGVMGGGFDFDSAGQQQLDFEESLVEESGFTTTYDLPGLKTLAPKSNSSKQRIARVNFTNVVFSHTVVAKYKPAAHLSAKLQNTSKLSLLRGPVGVTLDGSFMGRTTLPRCGAGGESIRLSLGVDPAIRVVYAPPEMKRATTGFFTKEDIKLYTRVVLLENTRTSNTKHTKLLVRDQIPASRDDKLRVELLQPEGLVPEGAGKEAGEAGRDKDKDAWGTAEAHLKKHGEVNWLVALRPGKSVKLAMEYLVATPIGDQAVQA